MICLSAFADEIAADLETQVAILRSENIHYVEFRSAWGVNVLDLSDQQIAETKRIFAEHGIGVAAIGSPIGKVPIDSSFDRHLQQFERAITVAQSLNTSYVRIFSFYPPSESENGAHATWRDEVLRRLSVFTARARSRDYPVA